LCCILWPIWYELALSREEQIELCEFENSSATVTVDDTELTNLGVFTTKDESSGEITDIYKHAIGFKVNRP